MRFNTSGNPTSSVAARQVWRSGNKKNEVVAIDHLQKYPNTSKANGGNDAFIAHFDRARATFTATLADKDVDVVICQVSELLSRLEGLSRLKPAAFAERVCLDDLARRVGRKVQKHPDCAPTVCGLLDTLRVMYSAAASDADVDCTAFYNTLVALFFVAERVVKKKQGRSIPDDPIEYETWLGRLTVGTEDFVPILDPARLGLAVPSPLCQVVSGGIAPADSSTKSVHNPFPPTYPATSAAAATVPNPQEEHVEKILKSMEAKAALQAKEQKARDSALTEKITVLTTDFTTQSKKQDEECAKLKSELKQNTTAVNKLRSQGNRAQSAGASRGGAAGANEQN